MWLADLDPDAEGYDLDLDDPTRRFEWVHEGWKLIFRPIPRRASVRDTRAERPLGAFIPEEAKFIDDIGSLKEALLDKGSKYGELEHPLVLAIDCGSGFHDDRDTIQALYGTVGWRFDFGSRDAEPIAVITEQGFWGPPGHPMRTHIAGVLLAEGLHYGRVAQYSPTFWPHPEAAVRVFNRCPSGGRLGRATRTSNTRQRNELHVYFELPEDWPQGEPFPRQVIDGGG